MVARPRGVDPFCLHQPILQLADSRLDGALLVLGGVVLGIFLEVFDLCPPAIDPFPM